MMSPRAYERLDELAHLKHGWLDGQGAVINEKARHTARSFITARASLADTMKIYPNEGGGVLIELLAGGWDMSLEFAADGSIDLYGIEVDGEDEMEPLTFADLDESLLAAFDAKVRH